MQLSLCTILSLSLAASQALAAPTAETPATISSAIGQESVVNSPWEDNFLERDSVPADANSLSKRARPVWKNTVCGIQNGWEPTMKVYLDIEISKLRSWKGIITMPGKECKLITRDNTRGAAAIWLCNDNAAPLQLPSYVDIADAAQKIISVCGVQIDVLTSERVIGQQFAEGNWNVIVRADALKRQGR